MNQYDEYLLVYIKYLIEQKFFDNLFSVPRVVGNCNLGLNGWKGPLLSYREIFSNGFHDWIVHSICFCLDINNIRRLLFHDT
jgi:hypothetical protein